MLLVFDLSPGQLPSGQALHESSLCPPLLSLLSLGGSTASACVLPLVPAPSPLLFLGASEASQQFNLQLCASGRGLTTFLGFLSKLCPSKHSHLQCANCCNNLHHSDEKHFQNCCITCGRKSPCVTDCCAQRLLGVWSQNYINL